MLRWSVLGCALLGACGSDTRDEAWEAYAKGDHATFVALMSTEAARSRSAIDLYNLACGYALSGDEELALGTLAAVAERGETFDMLTDPDLASLHDDPRFYAIAARAEMRAEADPYLEPFRDLAMEAYEAGRFSEFASISERIAEYSPSDRDLYNLACAYALTQRNDEALATLQKVAARGADFGARTDPDFAALRADPRFWTLFPPS